MGLVSVGMKAHLIFAGRMRTAPRRSIVVLKRRIRVSEVVSLRKRSPGDRVSGIVGVTTRQTTLTRRRWLATTVIALPTPGKPASEVEWCDFGAGEIASHYKPL